MATTASREGDVPPLASHSAEDQTVPRKYYILADTGPSAVRDVLEAEGWLPYIPSQSPYWNLWWKGSRFLKSDYADLTSYQRLNHFPRTTALTRKDSLYRLLRTMRGIYGVSHFDFVPETWSLPNDYTKFVKVYADEEFDGRGRRRGMWICKPADQSRGRGVFVFRELGALMYEGNAVLQRYIGNPLLISGYKFDMRCYVVVRSYSPLVIYNYHEGLARFATHPYTPTDDSNIYAHLTNTSINKFSPWLSHEKEEVGAGCRWTFGRLRKWFEACGIDGERVWRRIHGTIVSTLLPIAAEVPSVPDGCFELYGFDILLDDALKPWLLEVNFGPALSLDTDVDVEVKKPLIRDILKLTAISPADLAQAQRDAHIASLPARRRPSSASSIRASTPSRSRPSIVKHPVAPQWVGGLERIFPFNETTSLLSRTPLTVGKPPLKKVMQEVKKVLLD